tara:strand:- start:1098 stop:1244 length:147 start_codon:yes stop_codon:yes gene_type:complete
VPTNKFELKEYFKSKISKETTNGLDITNDNIINNKINCIKKIINLIII